MLTSRKLGAVAAVIAAASLTLAAGSAGAKPLFRGHDIHGPAGAVFVQSDDLTANTITVYARKHDGTLSQAGTYGTGGQGGQLTGSVVDHIASQDSLVYDAAQRELFAVNAGSNTVSVFRVDGDHLQLRQVVDSGGTFPVSITAHGDLVYVLNALGLDGGAIQGYRLIDGNLSPIAGSSRALGLDPTATPQFTNTPGDIAFTPDGRDLLVTTKANGNDIDVFSVDASGLPATAPVFNNEPGAVPFSIAFEGSDQVDIGEAGPNAVASFDLLADGTLVPLSTLDTGQMATCWLVADGPVLFAGNAGSHSESSVLDSSGALTLAGNTNTDAGTVDATTSPDGRYLYVQTGGNGIVDEYWVGSAGSLTEIGSVTVPNAVGGEGIAAS